MKEETKAKIGMIIGVSLIVLGQVLGIIFAWIWS
jgi:hypothetical protein